VQRSAPRTARTARRSPPALIGVGVEDTAAGSDAIALGAMLAAATGAELLLIGVHVEEMFALNIEGWERGTLQKQAHAMLAAKRDALAPDASLAVQSDALVWRGLRHVGHAQHCDVLVVGSAHDAEDGHVRLGRHARELQSHLECALAVAPLGMRRRAGARLERIGVGFDGGAESAAALGLAGALALAAQAELRLCGAVDREVVLSERPRPALDAVVEERATSLSRSARALAQATGARTSIEIVRDDAVDALSDLCDQVDLVVIGSCRTGLPGTVEAGRTGGSLLRSAACPVLLVPRPGSSRPVQRRTHV
jgi:nucleotide-binding universal stress UspA family protein